jgi:hypothetical protein
MFGLRLEQRKKMSSTDMNKSVGKSARRPGKGKQRRQKPDPVESPALVESPVPVQMQSPEPDQQVYAEPDQAQPPAADPEPAVNVPAINEPIEATVTAPVVVPAAVTAPEVPPAAAPSPVELAPVSLQTIANAYRDYTRKSFEEIGCYFEQLTGARSLDKAMKVQSDFMKRAYETSVAESQRIYELHNRLARQTFQPFQRLMGKMPETHGKS